MKLNENLPDLEIDGNLESTGKASIAEKNLAMAFSIVSEGFYSDIYGSIVRELTSNCVDSHTEAGLPDNPVVINFTNEEGVDFISFIDTGLGMTSDFFENTFMSYFESTKRESNAFYGAFGVGSKSPLGYQDSYEVITTKDNITCHYVIAKSVDGPPTFDLLSRREEVKLNGTEVRIIIEEGDRDKFKEAIKEQLQYFDNVLVKGTYFNNHYQIIEKETFKYRTDYLGFYDGSYKSMHIAVGRVTYPINFKKLDIPEINCPIGLKFDIGELIVTKNRENLRYDSEDCNSLIKERIALALEELGQIYNNQSKNSLTLKEYVEALRVEDKYIKLTDTCKLALPYHYKRGIRGGEKREFLVKNLVDPVYKPLEGFNLIIPRDYFFQFEIVKFFDDTNKRNFTPFDVNNMLINSDGKLVRAPKDLSTITNQKNKYVFWKLKKENRNLTTVGLVALRKFNSKESKKRHWNELNQKLGLNNRDAIENHNSLQIFKNRVFRRYRSENIPNIDGNLNKSKRIIAFKKAMIKEMIALCPSYRDFHIDQEFLDWKKENTTIIRNIVPSGFIKIKDIITNSDVELSFKQIVRNTRVIVYGFKEDLKKLRIIQEVLALGKSDTHSWTSSVYVIPKKAIPYFEANEKSYTMGEFLTNGNKFFKRAINNVRFTDFLKTIEKNKVVMAHLKLINKDLHERYIKIKETLDYRATTLVNSLKSNEGFLEDCFNIMNEKKWWNEDYIELEKDLSKFVEGLELLHYLDDDLVYRSSNYETTAHPHIIEFLKLKKKKVNTEYYLKKPPKYIIGLTLNVEEYANMLADKILEEPFRVFANKTITI